MKYQKNLDLWQFRLRTLYNYNVVSIGENIEIGHLIKIFKFMKCGDYISKGSYIINDEDHTRVSQFK
jgi:hypothetical protein